MSDLLKAATPRPWYVTENGDFPLIREVSSDFILAMADDGGHVDDSVVLDQSAIDANAELIVKAVNSYEPMLEALEAHAEWDKQEKLGPQYGELNRDTHPNGEAIWKTWWNNQLDLCDRATTLTKKAIALTKAEASQMTTPTTPDERND